MTTETVAIQVPQALYRRLARLAELTHRPIESLVEQALSSTIPPLPDDLPDVMRDALIALEALSDGELWQVFHSRFTDEQYEQYCTLREKNRQGTMTGPERATLDDLRQEADLLMLRKAYAAVLLKWRGYQLPTLAELDAQQ